ncbi:MAG TPA: hypothetical protein VMR96_09950 [Solirubrobacterales bacterium]|nr:hypothetical protein [Solirubrobacterales bacterium]
MADRIVRGNAWWAAMAALAFAVVLVGGGQRSARAAEGDINACGCRQGGDGLCYCERKSRCGCPGECEPKGCEEKRAKQMEREIEVETKKAQEATRRQSHSQRDSDDDANDRTDSRPSTVPVRAPKAAPAPRSAVIKMTASQKRDLARLIGIYLAAHPDQGGKAIDQVQSEMNRK